MSESPQVTSYYCKCQIPPLNNPQEGLYISKKHGAQDLLLPLTRINFSVKIHDNISTTTITQEYHNHYPHLIDTEYYFPIGESTMFTDFTAQFGDELITCQIGDKEEM